MWNIHSLRENRAVFRGGIFKHSKFENLESLANVKKKKNPVSNLVFPVFKLGI